MLFLKSYELIELQDNRPVDDWGNPIGKPYKEKRWDELSPEEMMADFDWKGDILSAYGEEVSGETFYQDYLFRELYNGSLDDVYDYKVVLTSYESESNKMHKIDVDDIQNFTHLNDVALSPCLFFGNWRRKKLLNFVSAFILDIDKLRPKHLERFLMLIEEGRLLKPTFISNSGSGVHFYYLLDSMLRCDTGTHEANNRIAEEIYNCLYNDVIKKEKWPDAQKHWLGQDYRVVGSKTKLHQVARIYKTGDVYSIENLTKHYNVKINPTTRYATKAMVKYANSISKELQLDPPDYNDVKATYDFIAEHKDEAYKKREKRRQERASKTKGKKRTKPVTWYRNTLAHIRDNTKPGYRFSSLKALAIIAYKEQVTREVFANDLEDLSVYWKAFDWNGDDFNQKNVEAILRLYDNAITYSNTTAEVLEEWLGYSFKRIGNKRNGRTQADHIKLMNFVRDELNGNKDWRNKEGRPLGSGTKEQIIKEYRAAHPEARKADCIRDTGLAKHTVYKWWDS